MYKNPVYKWWEFTANLNWLAEFQDFWSINDVSFAAKVVGRDDQQYSPSDFWTMMIYQWYNVKSHQLNKSKSGSVGNDQIFKSFLERKNMQNPSVPGSKDKTWGL